MIRSRKNYRRLFAIGSIGLLGWLLVSCDAIGLGDASSLGEPAVSGDAANSTPVAASIYTNGKIYTVNESQLWAEAIAVIDGRIAAVGSNEEVMSVLGNTALMDDAQVQVHDLQGHMVMPGIQDTHMHPLDAGLGSQVECAFAPTDLAAALSILQDCLKQIPEGQWLRGGQWHGQFFSFELAAGKRPKQILDEIAPNHPVFLMDWSVHNAWVNSKALEMLGIDEQTADPSGGVIVRDKNTGLATGVLLDNAAYDYRRALPQYSAETLANAMSWSMNRIASYGVTTIKDALTTRTTMDVYQALHNADKLPINIKTNLTWKSAWANSHKEELALIADRSELANASIGTDFAKIMLDGVPMTYTSALLEPYEPSAAFGDNHLGKLMHDPEQLAKDLTSLDAQGITVKIHATGDRAVRVALDAIEAARDTNGDTGLIHELSHAEMIHADDVPRFAELNVAAEMCPILWYPIEGLDWSHWLGEQRSKVWPIKTMVETGALVIYGSDWPVVPTPNPWPGIESMVTRSDPASENINPDWPEQAITLKAALQIFTLNGAIANKVGDRSGSLEVGKEADFIVLDRHLFDIPITEVGETQVLMSVVTGEVIFGGLASE